MWRRWNSRSAPEPDRKTKKAFPVLQSTVACFVFLIVGGIALADRFEDLINKLQSKTTMERREAALALGKTRDPRAVIPLIGLLKDDEPMVRLDASGALIEIGAPAVNSLIETVARDDDAVFLWNAIRVLEEIGDPKAIEPLKQIRQKHGDPSIQQIAKYAIDKLERAPTR